MQLSNHVGCASARRPIFSKNGHRKLNVGCSMTSRQVSFWPRGLKRANRRPSQAVKPCRLCLCRQTNSLKKQASKLQFLLRHDRRTFCSKGMRFFEGRYCCKSRWPLLRAQQKKQNGVLHKTIMQDELTSKLRVGMPKTLSQQYRP